MGNAAWTFPDEKIQDRALFPVGAGMRGSWVWLEMTAARGNWPFLWFMPASKSTAQDPQYIILHVKSSLP